MFCSCLCSWGLLFGCFMFGCGSCDPWIFYGSYVVWVLLWLFQFCYFFGCSVCEVGYWSNDFVGFTAEGLSFCCSPTYWGVWSNKGALMWFVNSTGWLFICFSSFGYCTDNMTIWKYLRFYTLLVMMVMLMAAISGAGLSSFFVWGLVGQCYVVTALLISHCDFSFDGFCWSFCSVIVAGTLGTIERHLDIPNEAHFSIYMLSSYSNLPKFGFIFFLSVFFLMLSMGCCLILSWSSFLVVSALWVSGLCNYWIGSKD